MDAQQLAARRIIGAEAHGPPLAQDQRTIGFHGGKVAVHRPQVRSYDGHEVALPTWTAAGRGGRRASSGEPSGCPRAICQSLPGMAPRSQRPRVGSWHCRQNGWPSGWRRTCPTLTSWSFRSTGCSKENAANS